MTKEMKKTNATFSFRDGYKEKIERLSKQWGITQSRVLEDAVDKIKEEKIVSGTKS